MLQRRRRTVDELIGLQRTGKRAIVIGASNRIGLAMTRGLAREGADVIVTARTQSAVDKAAADFVSELGVRAHGVASDGATAAGCDAIVSAAAMMGGANDVLEMPVDRNERPEHSCEYRQPRTRP